MQAIDNIELTRGRYMLNDLSLAPDGQDDDDDNDVGLSGGGSFEDSNLEGDLVHELRRRALRRNVKRCAVGVALLGLLALFVGVDKDGKLGLRHDTKQPMMGPGVNIVHPDTDSDDDPFPILDKVPSSGNKNANNDKEDVVETIEEGTEDIKDLAALFNAQQALPPYKICPPPIKRDRPSTQKAGDAVFHMGEFITVPEDDSKKDDNNPWQYSLSDMDVSNDASIIALGMGDYAADTGYAVGMVRVFAYACESQSWQRLGQDLLGQQEYEMFGHRVSSNRDGTVVAISAPQGDISGSKGFVEVYQIDNDEQTGSGKWQLLGSRIDSLDKAESEYYMLGHAVDLSDKGKTLAILAIIDDEFESPSYVTRVFDYDYRKEEWLRKGKDVVIANVTYGKDYAYDYSPQVSLSDTGDKLIVTDPQMGVVSYHFHFGLNHWKEEESRTPSWNDDKDTEYWISSLDLDDKAKLIAFSAFEQSDDGVIVDSVKFVNFQQPQSSSSGVSAGKGVTSSIPSDVYARDFAGWAVDLSVSVSDQGNVGAFVASKVDVDDANWWELYEYSYGDDIVGALTVVSKYEGDENWSVVGKGTEAESLGVSGSQVFLSGDGQIACVGYNTIVSLYGIVLDRQSTTGIEDAADESPVKQGESAQAEEETAASQTNICIPFPNVTTSGEVLGYIDDLPQSHEGDEKKQHTLSLSLSADASIVAVGIDSFDGEDRGLVRAFGWSCDDNKYVRLGQDLLGKHEFDGQGQSLDLTSDGKLLVVGANQPPPGKSGYVILYGLHGNNWKVTETIKDFPDGVSDIGRSVRLSNDGQTLMILGSINLDGQDSSFIRVLQKQSDKWIPVGDDIVASIEYDDYGTSAHATLSGDGNTVAVTGSYSQFIAKLYQFEASNWRETVIPPLACTDDDDSDNLDDDGLDYFYDCYFAGDAIAVNSAATILAVAGTSYKTSGGEVGTVRVLRKDIATGNFTVSEDPITFLSDYLLSSVDISDDGKHLAIGINGHSEDLAGQGQGVSFEFESTPGSWIGPVGTVDGTNQTDLLGARVRVTSNGRLAAASSKRGYISFFPAFSTTNMGEFSGSVDSYNPHF